MPVDLSVDPIAVLQAIGVRQPAAVTPLTGGADADIWKVSVGSHSCVLRVYPRYLAATYRAELAALRIAQCAGSTPIRIPSVTPDSTATTWTESLPVLSNVSPPRIVGRFVKGIRTKRGLQAMPLDAGVPLYVQGPLSSSEAKQRVREDGPPALRNYHPVPPVTA